MMEVGLKKKQKNYENSGLTIFLVITIFIGLSSFIYFTYAAINQKDSSSNQETKKFYLEVYKDKDGRLCLNKSENCSDLIYKIPTIKENANIIAVDSDNLFILYNDANFKIYNTKTSEIKDINLENNYTNYELYTTSEKDKVAGVIYKNDKYAEYYNVLTDEKLLENKYGSLTFKDENYLEGRIDILEERDAKIDLIELNNKKVILTNSMKEKGFVETYYVKKFENKYYIYSYCHCDVPGINFYTDDGKYFFSSPHLGLYSFSNNGNLMIAKEGKISKYDIDGNLLNISENYNNILLLTDKYIIYINELYDFKIDDIETKKNIKSFKLNSKYNYILYNMNDPEYVLTGCTEESYDGLNCPNSIKYNFNLNTLTLTEK